jgi:nitrogen fixation protein NifU and related proteins
MAKYPNCLLDHFKNPRNVGDLSNPDGVGTACNVSCGDIVQIYIKCDGSRISEVRFKTFGCGAAIAASSILTERIKGSTFDEALKMSEVFTEDLLSHLPEERIPCLKLASSALKLAIKEYRNKKIGAISKKQPKEEKDPK